MGELVLRERQGAVEVLTLNRPEARNALTPELLNELAVALHDCLHDASVRAVVLTGAGDKAFCAGMDLKAFAGGGDGSENMMPVDPEASATLARFFDGEYELPLIAAVNGAAVGGGWELVLKCDLIVAVDGARFGLPEVKRGLFAAGGGTMLSTRIPLALALEIGLTGEYIDAARAQAVGAVNQVVAADQLLPAALELAGKVAANGPLGVQLTKKLMRAAVTKGPEFGAATPDENTKVFSSNDAREGAIAFMEKREPNWTGS